MDGPQAAKQHIQLLDRGIVWPFCPCSLVSNATASFFFTSLAPLPRLLCQNNPPGLVKEVLVFRQLHSPLHGTCFCVKGCCLTV